MTSSGPSYWCHSCNRFVRVRGRDSFMCLGCGGGFVEEINTDNRYRSPVRSEMYFDHRANSDHDSIPGVRRNWRNASDRSLFNPVIVLHGPNRGGGGERGNYELYYDDAASSGLRPLPSSMSEFLMGSGFDRLLDQLAHLETNEVGRFDHPPASKAAIESLPMIKIDASHVVTDSHCAVCKEPFQLDSEACKMPCKHIYHSDCILPWLSIRSSCPVCRHELPTDVYVSGPNSVELEESSGLPDEDSMGLTIWRLPGGGYAVGRFTGGRRPAELELPVVYTEMDGGFNAGGAPPIVYNEIDGGFNAGGAPPIVHNEIDGGFDDGAAPRRIRLSTSANRARRSRMSRAFRSFFSMFGRFRFSSSHLRLEIGFRRSRSQSVFNNRLQRNTDRWSVDDSGLTRF